MVGRVVGWLGGRLGGWLVGWLGGGSWFTDIKFSSKREEHIHYFRISIAKGTEWAWLRPAATGDAQGDTAVAAAV